MSSIPPDMEKRWAKTLGFLEKHEKSKPERATSYLAAPEAEPTLLSAVPDDHRGSRAEPRTDRTQTGLG